MQLDKHWDKLKASFKVFFEKYKRNPFTLSVILVLVFTFFLFLFIHTKKQVYLILAVVFIVLFFLSVVSSLIIMLRSSMEMLLRPKTPWTIIVGYGLFIFVCASLFAIIYIIADSSRIGYLTYSECSQEFNKELIQKDQGRSTEFFTYSFMALLSLSYSNICPMGIDKFITSANILVGHMLVALVLGFSISIFFSRKNGDLSKNDSQIKKSKERVHKNRKNNIEITKVELTDEDKITILEYWASSPEDYLKVPPGKFGKEVSKEELVKLHEMISSDHESIQAQDLLRLAQHFRTKIKIEREIMFIDVQKDSLKNQKRTNNWQLVVAICLLIVTGAIGVATYNNSNRANQILEQQTEMSKLQAKLLEVSSQPYEPHIEYLQEPQNWHINAADFLKGKLANGTIFLHKPYSRLALFNFGKVDTQWTRCSMDWNNNTFFAQFKDSYPEYPRESTSFVFENIATGTASRIGFWIYYTPCGENISVCSKIDNIPLGNKKIILNCDCYWCKSQNTFNLSINFCVYLNESRDCY